MTDQSIIDVQEQATPPRLSDEALNDYRRLLNDPKFAEAHPEQHAALKASVENALAVTGQALAPAPDQRTPAQRHFDRNFAMDTNPELVAAVLRDANAADPQDPEQVTKLLATVGLSHKKALELAQQAVDHTPALAGVQVERLPAVTLAILAKYGDHLRKYRGKRPT